MGRKPDYYEILGVPRTASRAEIRRAYRRLARQLHPDVNPAPDAHQRFLLIRDAYEVLSWSARRRAYDQATRAGRTYEHRSSPPGPSPRARTYKAYDRESNPYAVWHRSYVHWAYDDLVKRYPIVDTVTRAILVLIVSYLVYGAMLFTFVALTFGKDIPFMATDTAEDVFGPAQVFGLLIAVPFGVFLFSWLTRRSRAKRAGQ